MSWLDPTRQRLRQIPAWVTLRRIQREGWRRALKRRRMWTRILSTPPIVTEPVGEGAAVEVHVLCCDRDYLAALWTLKSFYHYAGVRYPLVVHLQSRVSGLALKRLRTHLPTARIIAPDEATAAVEGWLAERGYHRLLAARRGNPFIWKLTDFPVLSASPHLVTLDSDVLFLRRPAELLLEGRASPPRPIFQRDAGSSYNISEEKALAELGIELPGQVNTGITLVPRTHYDLGRCEELLAHPEVSRSTGWIEQTLQALCGGERGGVEYLPDSYLVSFDTQVDLDRLVARHYAGPTRPLLTQEGMPTLLRRGFFEQLRAGHPPREEDASEPDSYELALERE